MLIEEARLKCFDVYAWTEAGKPLMTRFLNGSERRWMSALEDTTLLDDIDSLV